jgi:hypothetical protein
VFLETPLTKEDGGFTLISNNWRFKEQWRIVPGRFYQQGWNVLSTKMASLQNRSASIKQTHV